MSRIPRIDDLGSIIRDIRIRLERLERGKAIVGGSGGTGIPNPSTSVVSETAYGQAASAGTDATQFSLGSHTHGSPARELPAGGSTSQVLAKNSATDYDVGWATAGGGGGTFTSYNSLIASMTGLVHRWKFEEASGNFVDSVGTVNLTVGGTFTYGVTGGPVSGAAGSVQFGATAHAVSSSLTGFPTGTNPVTVVLIWKGQTTTGANQYLWVYGTAATRQLLAGAIFPSGGNIAFYGDGDDLIVSTASISEQWHMTAWLYDGNLWTNIFMDGTYYGHLLGAVLNIGTSNNLHIGQDWTGGSQLGNEVYDDLAIFNRCLQPYECQQLYESLVGALP